MKKLVLALGLGITLASSTFAADGTIEKLNSRVAGVLAPLQNESTIAKLTFDAVETNSEHADKVALHALFSKIGSQNKLKVKIDNLSYDYKDGNAPITILKGSFGIDFTKLLPQDQINLMIPNAAQLVEDFANDYASTAYGDALSLTSVVTSTTKDSDGNYTGLSALISIKIDLSKLPADIESKNINFTDAALSLALNLKTGIKVDAFVVSNPEYIGFARDQLGLKEILDKLLARDEETMDNLGNMANKMNFLAQYLVEMTNWLNISHSSRKQA